MRYLPLHDEDRAAMLATVAARDVEALFADVPASALLAGPVPGLPGHASEMAVERHMAQLATRNLSAADAPFFLGAGAYRHHIPASVDHLIQRGEFLTAYTPYQPEIAQGTLQTLFEFQTQVARLYGTDIANASMYDGSTACWEAVAMAARVTRRGRALLSVGVHPHYVATVRSMARFAGITLAGGDAPGLDPAPDDEALITALDQDTACLVVQYPDILGRIADLATLAAAAHERGALLIVVVTEPVALGLIEAPGVLGADIVVGEGQALGVGLQFGGPYLGLFGCNERFMRQMPGRLAGETTDANGRRSFVLTLATREQHIRREKATSNICTNSGLCALAFSIHMSLLGGEGLARMARLSHARARDTAARLTQIAGVRLLNSAYVNEFTLLLPAGVDTRRLVHQMAESRVLGGVALGRLYPGVPALHTGLLIATSESTSLADIAALGAALEAALMEPAQGDIEGDIG